jgi:hypothetical protein
MGCGSSSSPSSTSRWRKHCSAGGNCSECCQYLLSLLLNPTPTSSIVDLRHFLTDSPIDGAHDSKTFERQPCLTDINLRFPHPEKPSNSNGYGIWLAAIKWPRRYRYEVIQLLLDHNMTLTDDDLCDWQTHTTSTPRR